MDYLAPAENRELAATFLLPKFVQDLVKKEFPTRREPATCCWKGHGRRCRLAALPDLQAMAGEPLILPPT
jgi:hypothetical protein